MKQPLPSAHTGAIRRYPFERAKSELPDVPLPAPSWSNDMNVRRLSGIRFKISNVGVQGVSAQLQYCALVIVPDKSMFWRI